MTAEQIAIISLATNVSLVVVTTAYVVLTWRMAGAAKAAANFAAESAAAARSSLSIEFQLLSLTGTSPAGVSPALRGVLVSNTGSASVYVHYLQLGQVYELAGEGPHGDVFIHKMVNARLLPDGGLPKLIHHWEDVTLDYEGPTIDSTSDLVVGVVGYSLTGTSPILERSFSYAAALGRFYRWRHSRSVPYVGSGRFPSQSPETDS